MLSPTTCIWIARFSSLGFVVVITAAAACYPGGDLLEPGSTGYSFTTNPFSDLGMFHAHNGAPNRLSMPLFVLSLALAGTAIVAVVPARLILAGAGSVARYLLITLATLTAVGFLGVAATPADKLLRGHIVAVNFTFGRSPCYCC
jgi:hypothetical membrane protein